MSTTISVASCEATIRHDPGVWGFVAVKCGQVVGLIAWHDETGGLHFGCTYHVAELRHRYPAGIHDDHEAPADGCRDCADEMVWSYRSAVGWTESELRAAHGDR